MLGAFEMSDIKDDITAPEVKKRDNKAIMFLRRYERYNKAEIAGFPTAQADNYIKAGVAETPEKAKKLLAAKENKAK